VSRLSFRDWVTIDGNRVQTALIPANRALAAWREERARYRQTGLWPLVLGDSEELAAIREGMDDASKRASVLAEAAKLDAGRWLAEMRAEMEAPEGEEDSPMGRRLAQLGRAAPPPVEQQFAELRGKTVTLALVPAPTPEVAVITLPFGGWNDCPQDAVHVAVLGEWRKRYGAEPVVRTFDVIELLVPKPITDPKEAARLAEEQFAYAPDIVHQGTGSIAELADALLGRSVWFFWWD